MIDAWTSRTPQSTEFPKTETDGVKKLLDVIKRQGVELGEKTSNLFRTAGITISETLMTFANNVRVEGTLTSTGAASFGGTLTTTGTANIGGQMNVTGDAVFQGDLSVPNGSISNAALQSPVVFDTASGNAGTGPHNLLAAEQTFVSLAVAVPAGYTRGIIQAQGSIGLVNPTAGVASAAGRVYIDHPNPALSSFSARRWQSAAAGSDLAVFPVDYADFPVSGGSTITVRLTMQSVNNWGATVGGATLNVMALFTR